MADLETQVVVVGGGATGTAVLRDLALRGIDAVLVERADLGTGTSGRWHGLLHSGGRYVVKDPVSATECIEENMVLRRIAPHCIEDTGGLFVLLPENDQSYGDAFVEACAKTGVPCEELTPGEARRREPLLMPNLSRVFAVPDGTLDGWKLMGGFVADAKSQGARVLLRHPVVGFERDGDQIRAVRVRDTASGEDRLIGCQWVLNAAGAWAGQIATLAGGRLQMAPGKGAMVVMVGRYVRGVVNDCRMPGDGDIIVPVHEVAILGTTDVETDDPDDISVDPREVDFMIDSAAKMVPAVATGRVLRAFSGSRPLFKPEDAGGDSRDITRAFFVLDHSDREGPANLLSIVGGKLTTCRQMAERTVDTLVHRMGLEVPCTTAELPIPGAEHGLHRLADPLATVEKRVEYGELVCECELVTRARIEAAVDEGTTELDDLRRQLRLGYGPCQAAFSGWRAVAIVDDRRPGATEPLANLERFLEERWRGQQTTTWGDGAVQALLNQAIYRGIFDLQPDAGVGRGQAGRRRDAGASRRTTCDRGRCGGGVVMRTDVIVVGAGPAGLAAAAALAEAGRDVRVIARGNGFTHWGPGAVDVLARAGGEQVDRPLGGVARLPERHPYRLLGEEVMRRGIDRFQRFVAAAGLAYEGTLDGNRQQVTAIGTLRPTCLVPAPAAGRLADRVAVVGFAGFRDFSPTLCARELRDAGQQTSVHTVELPTWNHERNFTAVDLARAIDDPGFRGRLADGLGRASRDAEVAVVPAVLGLATRHEAWADLEHRAGAALVEAALAPPSIPGIRLYALWLARLRELGVRVQLGFPVTGVEVADGAVTAVVSEGASRPIVTRCNEVVLATGGVVGRGIEARRDGSLVETVAGLPVRGFADRVEYLADRFLDDHPLGAAGIVVDDELRPLDAAGEPALRGLRCVGSLLADHDPTAEGSREGVALATAARAAERLAAAPL